MKYEKVLALVPLLGTKVTGYRNGWVQAHCPFQAWKHDGGDAHPSFAIKAEKSKKSIYKCFSCGMGGDLMRLMIDIGSHVRIDPQPSIQLGQALQLVASEFEDMEFDPNLPDYSEEKLKAVDDPYPETWLASFKPYSAFEDARSYLATRQVNKALLEALDVRYDPIRKRVCFPFRNSKGLLMGLQGRLALSPTPDDALRYYFYPHPGGDVRNMHAWLGENHLNLDKPVVLVEGPFDYASVYRVYTNVAASFSSGLSEAKLQRLADATEIVTFYDAGKGGNEARKRIGKFFKGLPVTHVTPEKKDKDAGAMTAQEVLYHLGEYLPNSALE